MVEHEEGRERYNNHLSCVKTDLYEMVEHEGGDAGSSPLWVCKDEGDVGFIVLHVRHHEGKGHLHFPDHNKVDVRPISCLVVSGGDERVST